MTEGEAKGFIQGKLDCMKKCDIFNKEDNTSDNDCGNCEYCYSQGNFGEQKEAFSVAIQALEKQIAKKPTYEGDGYDSEGNFVYDTWICTCCEKRYEVDYDEYDFCPNCGQKIDWSEEDE